MLEIREKLFCRQEGWLPSGRLGLKNSRAGRLKYFLIFSIIKKFFAFFIKLIWLGVAFLK